MSPRLLIVTAAFGEGHNSAARNLALALEAAGAEAIIRDPCMLALPRTTAILSGGYRFLTNHLPKVWEAIYRSTDQRDFNRKRLPFMGKPERCLGTLIAEHRPSAVISTYPIYPYLLHRCYSEGQDRLPIFTVVTDSLEINSAWLRAPTDHWLVTDAFTREKMIRLGAAPGKVTETGFPVHPDFAQLTPMAASDSCDPFRVLYFPTARRSAMMPRATAMLAASPAIQLTLVLGKNFRHLYPSARRISDAFPGRVRLLGWTRRVPKLLISHHLVVGKAGGATVHEAIAARCPMLIHHLVPGQEEGNLRLLEKIGGGTHSPTPDALRAHLVDLLADRAAAWRKMKYALIRHGHQAGAIAAAGFVLLTLGGKPVAEGQSYESS